MKALAHLVLKELRVSARERRHYFVRVGYLLVLVGIFLLYWTAHRSSYEYLGQFGAAQLAELGRQLFWQAAVAQSILVIVIGPILSAGLVNSEARRRTLGLLYAGGLGSVGIATGKWLACVVRTALLAVAALPLLLIAKALGGATLGQLVFSTWGVLILACSGPAVGLFFSSVLARYHTALIGTFLGLAALFLGPLFFDSLDRIRFFVDPISVLAHVDDFRWIGRSPLEAMLSCTAVHAILSLFMLAGVCWQLPRLVHRTAGPSWTKRLGAWIDRLAEVRWRWNRSFGTAARPALDSLLRLECATGLTRTRRALGRLVLLLYVLLAVTYLLAGANLGRNSTLQALDAVLSGCAFLVVAAGAASSVSQDAERGTLDSLLVSPLEARDIVRAKTLATLRGALPVLLLPTMHGVFMLLADLYSPRVFARSLAVAWTYSFFCCGMGILASTLFRRSATATLLVLAGLAAAIVGPPLLSQLVMNGGVNHEWRNVIAQGCPFVMVSEAIRYRDYAASFWSHDPWSETGQWFVPGWIVGWTLAGLAMVTIAIKCFDRCTGRIRTPQRTGDLAT